MFYRMHICCPSPGLSSNTHRSQFSKSSRKLFITFIFQMKEESSICKERDEEFVPFLRRALLTTLDIPWPWGPEQDPREVM